jgi:hypothetical protein
MESRIIMLARKKAQSLDRIEEQFGPSHMLIGIHQLGFYPTVHLHDKNGKT